jgi:M6 family metalloprotease-like protein
LYPSRVLNLLFTFVFMTGFAGAAFAAFAPEADPLSTPDILEKLNVSQLLEDGSPRINRARLLGTPAPATLNVLILMCDFSDSLLYGRTPTSDDDPREASQTDWYYAAHDSVYFHHLFQDVQDYFTDVSGRAFNLDFLVHPGVAELSKPMGWYGNHPQEGEQPLALSQDVVAALDPDVDFKDYDTIAIVHAGAGEETDILGNSPVQIYTTYLGPEDFASAVEDALLETEGIVTLDTDSDGQPAVIEHVLILPENEYQDPVQGVGGFFGSVGVYCFEVGLRLGMLSLSDFTPSGIPDSQGIGQFGLMGYGLFTGAGIIPSHPCAFNKMIMGWMTPYVVDPDASGSYNLYPAENAGADSTLARVDISPSEYWLLEYRLQDPDGNAKYSFPGDLNLNGVPDFKDMDSEFGDFTPTGFFDPAVDEKERLLGGEFDFFMSDNDARAEGVKGAGNGLYIWHVDGGVIQSVIDLPVNLLNADPLRKAIDLEEADGIQDLDARIPTPYVLGGDDDCFRGEGNHVFSFDTNPSTATAGGAPTGIIIDRISNVVAGPPTVDINQDELISYAGFMSFRCTRQDAPANGPVLDAERMLPQIDLRGADLLATDLDDSRDDVLELVAAADQGRVLVFNRDLSDFNSLNAGVPGLWATGVAATGEPVDWNGGAVATDFDGDGAMDVLLTAASGLYAFTGPVGAELVDGDGELASIGLFHALAGCSQRPLIRSDVATGTSALVIEEQTDGRALRLLEIGSSGLINEFAVPDGAWVTVTPPYIWRDEIVLPLVDPAADIAVLWVPGMDRTFDLPALPVAFDGLANDDALILPVESGAIVIRDLSAAGIRSAFSSFQVLSHISPGPTFQAGEAFVVTGATGEARTGWPFRPSLAIGTSAEGISTAPLIFSDDGEWFYQFSARDGRLFLCNEKGQLMPNWPLNGPGESAGTPVLMDIGGEPGLELAAIGTFDREYETGDGGTPLHQTLQSTIRVWTLPGTEDATALWPMRNGDARGYTTSTPIRNDSEGSGLLVENSHICYPVPLTGDDLHVRAIVNQDASMDVNIYNLEGEEVFSMVGMTAFGGDPFEVVFNADGLASGLYVCKLRATAGGRSEISIISLAVAR